MSSRYPEVDLSGLRRTSITTRQSKVHLADLARAPHPGATVTELLDCLPHILAGDDIRLAVDAITGAAARKKPVVLCMGAHVIKTGMAPVLVDLMKREVITTIATNGAGAIHDLEMGLFGHTSEHVERGIGEGVFGMMKETADFINRAAVEGSKAGMGLGESVGRALLAADCPNRDQCLFASAYALKVPVTVHVGIGTDIVHMHPSADGAAIGDTSLRDFRILIEAMKDLGDGGVLLNFGSAVVMPEVVLKALTVLRNLGVNLEGFTSVNLDFMQHYRSTQQIVSRVKEVGGRGVAITGHHEIMIPLIAAAVVSRLES